MSRSYFVVFDGCDGSGKSLLSTLVRDYYRVDLGEIWRGRVIQTFMPGGTAVGQQIRGLLKDVRNTIDPIAERLLFAADNAQFMTEVIEANSDTGKLILCDRWSFFTDFCYGIPRGIKPETLRLLQSVIPKRKLDLLFICTTPFDICMGRVKNDHNRERTPCRIEQFGEEYMRRVWDMYHAAVTVKLYDEGTAWRLVQNLTSEVADVTIGLDGMLTPQTLCKIATDHINTMLKLKGETCESKE
jgi:dTMP kinase